MSSSVDKKDYKIMHEYYIIVAGSLKITVNFTRLGFCSIAKMQRYL